MGGLKDGGGEYVGVCVDSTTGNIGLTVLEVSFCSRLRYKTITFAPSTNVTIAAVQVRNDDQGQSSHVPPDSHCSHGRRTEYANGHTESAMKSLPACTEALAGLDAVQPIERL